VSVRTFDPISVEIQRKALENITNEMAIALTRTSGSPVIYEVQDFATSLMDRDGEHLSLSATVLFHSGSSLLGTRAVIDSVQASGEQVLPGDGWLVNDPFDGGALHQGDVGIIMPTFYEDEHVGCTFSNVHVLDVGGMGVSGFAPGAVSVYDEGIRSTATRMIRGGSLQPEWDGYLRSNVRIPDLVINDVRSMIAANNVGQQKLTALIDRFGREDFDALCEANKALTEEALRARIEKLPDGAYESAEWMEFDGHGEELLLEMRCRMEVDGSSLRFSFAGAEQVNGFLNGTAGVVFGSTLAMVQNTLAFGDMPFNAGMWRPVEVDLGPEGTIVNAVPPAPVSSGHAIAGFRVCRAVKEVLNQAVSLSEDAEIRGRVAGLCHDAVGLAPLAGAGHHGAPTVVFFMDSVTGNGGGAQVGSDGQDSYGCTVSPGIGLASVETNEATQPALYLWRSVAQNSGGPGINRGGQGVEFAYAVYQTGQLDGAVTLGCAEYPARGAGGGHAAGAGTWKTYHGTNVEQALAGGEALLPSNLDGEQPPQPSNAGRMSLAHGDVMRMVGGGGGGVGDPLLRSPDLVGADFADGYVTAAHAHGAYGVVLDEDGVDAAATEAQRARLRRERIGGEPAAAQGDPEVAGIAIVLSEDRQVWRCAYCDGDLGPVGANWREAAVTRTRSLGAAYGELEMQVRERGEGPALQVSEHYCGSCAGALGADLHPEGAGEFAAPRLGGGFDLPPLALG
jgi:N-methylhydantoinase B